MMTSKRRCSDQDGGSCCRHDESKQEVGIPVIVEVQ